MAEPKKETVQISLPPGPEQAGSALSVPKREATRILLPSRVAAGPILRVPPKITPSPSAEATTTIPPATPLSLLPDAGIQPAPAVISRRVTPVDAIPRPVCWGLLAISTVIFLIQIWNYVVS